MQKVNFRPPKIHNSFLPGLVLAPFWVPAGSPKSTKNRPGTEKVRPETAPEAIFVDFSLRCRSESLSGSIFAGSDPSKLCSHHNGSTILTKSPFSKKHRKSNLREPVWRPKMAKHQRRRHRNRQNFRKKSIFCPSIFGPFFRAPKKPKKNRKKRPTCGSWFGTTVSQVISTRSGYL